MATNVTREEHIQQVVYYWTSSVAVKHDGALLDGAWMALLVMTAGFLILMSTWTSRRQAMFWLQLLGIAVSVVVLVAHFEMNRRFLVLNIADFAAGKPAAAAGATLEWALALNLSSLISTWITDIVLPLKVLTFYPRTLYPSTWHRLAIVGVPIAFLLTRVAFIGVQGQCTWQVYQAEGSILNFCNYITPTDALFQALGNGFCTVLIVVNTRRLSKNAGRPDSLRFLLQATLFSFAPAVLVQILLVIVGFLDHHMQNRYYNRSILDQVTYQRWEDVYNDIGILNNVLTCVFAVIATTYTPLRLARRASSSARHGHSGSAVSTPAVQHRTMFSNLTRDIEIVHYGDAEACARSNSQFSEAVKGKHTFFLTTTSMGSSDEAPMRERKNTLTSQNGTLQTSAPPTPLLLQFPQARRDDVESRCGSGRN
ncbi:hypothetical protein CF327_g4199 [Tilletia walkeri]|uniref:Uncharacterized protein n=1 Tax=Tilletia walkeri TaxID=117179 RepID=A0A8X7NBF9_9BASI|nr:hypothetical protein CF327_g4199 [Tilletia walkeri]KAE8268941.1 hypothetical protein A4X09_0g3410 [Tilletia walkeri]